MIRRTYLLDKIELSPDGRYIATASTDPTSSSRLLLLISTDDARVRELMRVPSEVKRFLGDFSLGQAIRVPSGGWAPDSSSLLIRKNPSDRTKESVLLVVPINGGDPKILERGIPPGRGDMSVSPDGRHFAFQVQDPASLPTTELVVLQNFLPKTTKK